LNWVACTNPGSSNSPTSSGFLNFFESKLTVRFLANQAFTEESFILGKLGSSSILSTIALFFSFWMKAANKAPSKNLTDNNFFSDVSRWS